MLEVAAGMDWRFEVALILANETGHRSSAIRQLRWSDVDFTNRTVRWRRDADKAGREHVTPLTDAAIKALQRAQQARAAIARCVGPAVAV
jgi:integrase